MRRATPGFDFQAWHDGVRNGRRKRNRFQGPSMLATPLPILDAVKDFPELAPLARTAVRLHPRRAHDGFIDASRLGGTFLWPLHEPWPAYDENRISRFVQDLLSHNTLEDVNRGDVVLVDYRQVDKRWRRCDVAVALLPQPFRCLISLHWDSTQARSSGESDVVSGSGASCRSVRA